jgi:hypothetical protein
MNPSPTNRSGRPLGAAGPLVSAVVGLMTVIGLGCAGAGVIPPSVADATESVSRSGQATSLPSLDLRPLPPAAPADAGQPSTREPGTGNPGDKDAPAPVDATSVAPPDVPVVDAAPRRLPSTRPAQPVRIRIAEVAIDVVIRPTGVAEDGSMELPGTIRRAGWYRFGSTPNHRTGTTVIAAHVDTRAEGLGPFARLSSVRRGERIVVTDRAGDDHAYRIVSRRHIDRSRLPIADLFDRDGPPRLVVLTCGGAYDARNGYRDNVVVIAEPDR